MRKPPRKPALNVVPITAEPRQSRGTSKTVYAPADAGSPQDPRMLEAMRLVEAFLAIEDEQGRAALITLAERLVSYDWALNVQRR